MKPLTPEERRVAARAVRRAVNRRRYMRQFARRTVPESPAPVVLEGRPISSIVARGRMRRLLAISRMPPGFWQYMQAVAASLYGKPGTWGHGKHAHRTAKGPGLRPPPRIYRATEGSPLCFRDHPVGTKLVRRIIRHGGGEQVAMRRLYARLVGRQYNE